MHLYSRLFYTYFGFYLFSIAQNVTGQCTSIDCGGCIRENCSWCKQEVYSGQRCADQEDLIRTGCAISHIVGKPDSILTGVVNNSINDESQENDIIQLQPQKINISLALGNPYKFTLKYNVVESMPTDIYVLFDPSFTMRFVREAFIENAGEIGNILSNFSNDLRIAYGTFVDKVIIPFTHTSKPYLQNPCPAHPSMYCDTPYSFLHRLNFTSNITNFLEAVSETLLTANNDILEGQLDGLMQVLSCQAEIGWRKHARKIVFLLTENAFKFAGDGKLAGIVKPYDLQCHLSRYNSYLTYTHDTLLDYPSIGQITDSVVMNDLSIIFLISDRFDGASMAYTYSTLNIPGSVTNKFIVGNMMSVLSESYQALLRQVTIVYDHVDEIDIQLKTTCNGRNQYEEGNSCKNLAFGEIVEFDVIITLIKCPDDINSNMIKLRPIGQGIHMTVDLEYLCSCKCQEMNFVEVKSTKCNNNGRLECGTCYCNSGYIGEFCDWNKESICSQIINNNTIVCSNVGTCRYGRCSCPPSHSGLYCECDNRLCGGFVPTGDLCNGNGVCDCGDCRCLNGFTGQHCECPTTLSSCRNDTQAVCSGNGKCKCGKCICNKNYSGRFCEDCSTCNGCEINKICAECVGFQKGLLSAEECQQRCSYATKANQLNVGGTTIKCQIKDSDGCLMEFTYVDEGDLKQKVVVKNERSCPFNDENSNSLGLNVGLPLGIVLGAFIGMIVVAVVLKCLGAYNDRRVHPSDEEEEESNIDETRTQHESAWNGEQNTAHHRDISDIENNRSDQVTGNEELPQSDFEGCSNESEYNYNDMNLERNIEPRHDFIRLQTSHDEIQT